MIQAIEFDFANRKERAISQAEVADCCGRGLFCWVDIDVSKAEAGQDAKAVVGGLLRDLKVDAMAIEEVLGPDREGRYDVHEGCLHFALSEGRLEGDRLITAHVDVVLGERFLVTFHRRDVEFLRLMRRTYREDFLKFARSPGFLLYEIGDHLIDGYKKTLQRVAEEVEKVQLQLFGEVDDGIFKHVAELTSDILQFRKIVMASRELFHELASRRSEFVSETTQPFLESMAGTMERLSGDLTTEREVLNETLNLYMGMVSHRTNKVVNRLTVISVIFLPLSFLCGVYGMNLKGIPETEWDYGYPAFWTLAILLSGVLLLLMRRYRWV
jgi:magnesium transporter